MKELTIQSKNLPEYFSKNIVLKKANEVLRLIIQFSEKVPKSTNFTITLKGKRSGIEIFWVYKGGKKLESDIGLYILHDAPETISRINFKAVLDDESKVRFNGTIHITKKAKLSDAYLSAKALMLSEKSIAFVKPNLEVKADEVKAQHGSSIGRISKSDLFYLQSRGIPKEKAKKLLADAFLHDLPNL